MEQAKSAAILIRIESGPSAMRPCDRESKTRRRMHVRDI